MKKIEELLGLLIIILPIIKGNEVSCSNRVKCGESLSNHMCYFTREGTPTETIAYKCQEGEICVDSEDERSAKIGICQKPYRLSIKGEKCEYNEECYSGKCDNKVCVQLLEGEKCNSYVQCLEGYKCNGACQKLSDLGESCFSHSDCVIGTLCGISDPSQKLFHCIKMFSIKEGDYSSHNLLCETGALYENICIDLVAKNFGKICETSKDCELSFKFNKTKITQLGTCTCTLDGEKKVCVNEDSKTIKKKYSKIIFEEIEKIKKKEIPYINGDKKIETGFADIRAARITLESPLLSSSKDCIKDFFKSLLGTSFNHFSLKVLLILLILFN